MAVVIDEMAVDVEAAEQPKKRGGGDSGSNSGGGAPPQPEELERIWQQQSERMERIRAH